MDRLTALRSRRQDPQAWGWADIKRSLAGAARNEAWGPREAFAIGRSTALAVARNVWSFGFEQYPHDPAVITGWITRLGVIAADPCRSPFDQAFARGAIKSLRGLSQ